MNIKQTESQPLKWLQVATTFILGVQQFSAQCTYTISYNSSDTITTNSGTVCDPGGTSNYIDGSDGQLIIRAVVPGHQVQLRLSVPDHRQQTEYLYDFVTIYDGEGTGGNILYRNSGGIDEAKIISSCASSLTIRFTSDYINNDNGFSFVISNSEPFPNSIAYVDASISVSGNGQSWNTAFKTLQEAINVTSCNPLQIWVANGTYYPTEDFSGNLMPVNSRTKTFHFSPNHAIYGGFVGNETSLAQRNPGLNNCILSGNIDLPTNVDNVYHVLTGSNLSNPAEQNVLDGFIIEDAFSTQLENKQGGGLIAVNANIKLQNCIFRNNTAIYGSGIFNLGLVYDGYTAGNIQIDNLVFVNNLAHVGGAAVASNHGYTEIRNTTFTQNIGNGNSNAIEGAGAILNYWGRTFVKNSIISGNITSNSANPDNKSIVNEVGQPVEVEYSIIEQTTLYPGNLNILPTGSIFTNTLDLNGADDLWMTTDDGLVPICGSQAIESGRDLGNALKDIKNSNRINGSFPDLGAYESNGFVAAQATGYACYLGEINLNDYIQNASPNINLEWHAFGNSLPIASGIVLPLSGATYIGIDTTTTNNYCSDSVQLTIYTDMSSGYSLEAPDSVCTGLATSAGDFSESSRFHNAFKGSANDQTFVNLNSDALPRGNQSYTFAAWIKTNDNFTDGGIVGFGDYGNGNRTNHFRLQGADGSSQFGYLNNYWWGNDFMVALPQAIDSVWNHVAVTYNNENHQQKMYLNGIEIGARLAYGLFINNISNAVIGTSNMGYLTSDYFDGGIDAVQIWTKALTATEINVYKKGIFCEEPVGLVANYNFDEGNNTIVKSSVNRQYLATSNSANIWYLNPISGCDSLAFNYTDTYSFYPSTHLYLDEAHTIPYIMGTYKKFVWVYNPAGTQVVFDWIIKSTNCCSLPENQLTANFKVLPTVAINALPTSVCINNPLLPVIATPAGGTLSGNGIFGTNFNASAVTANTTATIQYNYTAPNGCDGMATATIFVDACASLASEQNQLWDIIFPNPNNGIFTLQLKSASVSKTKVSLFTNDGKIVYTSEIEAGQTTKNFELSNLSSGIYFLSVITNETETIHKVQLR
jgi:hypothetical protein